MIKRNFGYWFNTTITSLISGAIVFTSNIASTLAKGAYTSIDQIDSIQWVIWLSSAFMAILVNLKASFIAYDAVRMHGVYERHARSTKDELDKIRAELSSVKNTNKNNAPPKQNKAEQNGDTGPAI